MPIPGIEVLFKSKVVLGSDEAAVEFGPSGHPEFLNYKDREEAT